MHATSIQYFRHFVSIVWQREYSPILDGSGVFFIQTRAAYTVYTCRFFWCETTVYTSLQWPGRKQRCCTLANSI